MEVDVFDFGYGLVADGVKVASLAESRIGYRGWARRRTAGQARSPAQTTATTAT